MQGLSEILNSLSESFGSQNSCVYRWIQGESFSFEALSELFPLWNIFAIACLIMIVAGIGFLIGGRFRRGLVAVLSGFVYTTPLALLLLCDPENALDVAASATFMLSLVWFFVANCIVYRISFIVRLIVSYIHFLLTMFSGAIAADTSVATVLITVWCVAVGLHLFVFIIPYLPDWGSSSGGLSLNDMIGDEYDDSFVDGM